MQTKLIPMEEKDKLERDIHGSIYGAALVGPDTP